MHMPGMYTANWCVIQVVNSRNPWKQRAMENIVTAPNMQSVMEKKIKSKHLAKLGLSPGTKVMRITKFDNNQSFCFVFFFFF